MSQLLNLLKIDKAIYFDVLVREGDTTPLLLEFYDDDDKEVDITNYNFVLMARRQSKQIFPDIKFSTQEGDFVPYSFNSLLWNVDGNKTKGKEGSYTYYLSIIDNSNNSNTAMYGKFTVINKES